MELDKVDMHRFIIQRLMEADKDTSALPNDSLQTCAHEGQTTSMGSISPLVSLGAQSEQEYNYPNDIPMLILKLYCTLKAKFRPTRC